MTAKRNVAQGRRPSDNLKDAIKKLEKTNPKIIETLAQVAEEFVKLQTYRNDKQKT